MNKEVILKKINNILKEHFDVAEIYLFGSQARNQENTNSDYDIAVVVNTLTSDKVKMMTEARTLLATELGIACDVLFYTKNSFEQSAKEFNSIPEIVTSEGKRLDDFI